jgi:type I restriction enzyme S subunit
MVSNVDKVPSDDEQPVRLCNYTDVYKNEFISPGMDFMGTTATEAEIEKFGLLKNDVVITKDSESWDDIAIPSLIADAADDLLCGYHLAILRPKPEALNGRFLFRCLQSKSIRLQLELASTGVTRFGLPKGEIGRMSLPVAPMGEQQSITDYLDRETSQIDILIKEKECMLALLAEKRAALISHAVTCGLDPDASLKPSGYFWLGDIPAHWKVRRCASLFKEIDERNQPDLPLLNVSLNTGVTLRVFSDNKIESVAADFASYKVARKGNLAFNKMRFWQGAVGVAPEDGLVSPDYTVAGFGPEMYADYIESLFRIPQFIMEIRRHSHGIVDDRLRLYWDGFKNIRIPVPPLSEQKTIAEYLLNERRQGAEIEVALNQSVELLKERRSALITAAITGQLEIPEISSQKEGQDAH